MRTTIRARFVGRTTADGGADGGARRHAKLRRAPAQSHLAPATQLRAMASSPSNLTSLLRTLRRTLPAARVAAFAPTALRAAATRWWASPSGRPPALPEPALAGLSAAPAPAPPPPAAPGLFDGLLMAVQKKRVSYMRKRIRQHGRWVARGPHLKTRPEHVRRLRAHAAAAPRVRPRGLQDVLQEPVGVRRRPRNFSNRDEITHATPSPSSFGTGSSAGRSPCAPCASSTGSWPSPGAAACTA